MNRPPQYLILASISVLAFFLVGNGGYVLPVPDGGELHPSPPSLVGTLKAVSANDITVLPKGGARPVVVRITKDTTMFTTAGGYVPPERLVLEGPVEVWFTPESLKNKRDAPVAAVVRVETRKVP
jgi:hypothetical protein